MINKNEKYTVEITSMSHEGLGIAKIEGFTVFIEGAIEGETIETLIVKVNKSYGFGKLLKIIKTSPSRIEEQCGCAKRCGGCQLQHMDYDKQLEFKTKKVEETIKRIGKIDTKINNTIGMSNPYNYRNKVQVPVGLNEGKLALGFYAQRSHSIIEGYDCNIQFEEAKQIIETIKNIMTENNIAPYDEMSHSGLIRHIVLRKGFTTDEIMVVIVTNGQTLTNKEKIVSAMAGKFGNIKSIVQNINTDKTNVILGTKNITLYGKDTIIDYIGQFKFEISPLSFFQVNPVQTQVLYQKALEFAGLTGSETVFDAYCGIGTISFFLSQKAKMVYGIEIVKEAIDDARENAKANGVINAEFIVGESETAIPTLYKKGITADVVVVDPPRKGCDKALLDTIIEMKPKRIVYVSCDVGTLARDLRILEDGGFEVKEVQPVDMFPWTFHVECVVRIQRKN